MLFRSSSSAGAKKLPRSFRGDFELHSRAAQNRLGKNAVIFLHQRMMSKVRIAHHRPNRQTAIRKIVDLVQRETSHVDEFLRRLDIQLHQIDQRRAAGNEAMSAPCCAVLDFAADAIACAPSVARVSSKVFTPISPCFGARFESLRQCLDTRRNGKCSRSCTLSRPRQPAHMVPSTMPWPT